MSNAGHRPRAAQPSHIDAFNGVTTGRGHLTGKKDSVQANIQQVLAEKEVNAAVATAKSGDGCCES